MTNDCNTDSFTPLKAQRPTPAGAPLLTVRLQAVGILADSRDWSSGCSDVDSTWRISPAAVCCDFSGDVAASCGWQMDIPAGTPVFGFGLRLEQPLAKLPEQIQISEAQTAVRPANLDAAQAAVMATPGSLACKAVCRLINVRAGQRVMVVDADCPVGWNVVRLLSGLGAEAVAMVDADGFERMKRAGADLIVNKRVLRPERITGSCDAVVDLSPTARPVSYLPCIARGGTLVSRDLLPERELLEAFGLRGVRLTPAIDKELLTTLAYLIEEHILIPFVVPTGRLAL